MWLTDRMKGLLKGSRRDFSEVPPEPPRGGSHPESGVAPAHRSQPGSFASDAPTPSKVAVLLFYISCSFCVLGIILVVRSFFIRDVSFFFFFFNNIMHYAEEKKTNLKRSLIMNTLAASVQGADKMQILTFGSGVSLVGVILAVIMNVMNKREHDRCVPPMLATVVGTLSLSL